MKQKATGIGGVFFRAKNPAKLGAWYSRHLGLPVDEQWNGCQLHWRELKNPNRMKEVNTSRARQDARGLESSSPAA